MSGFVADLETHLTTITTSFPSHKLLLMGDFNFPEITWCDLKFCVNLPYEARTFVDLCLNFNLDQLVKVPTRVSASSSNTLDLILSNDPDIISTICCFDGPSDHKFLSFSLLTAPPPVPRLNKVLKNYHAADFNSINTELASFFDVFVRGFSERSVEENWCLFKEKLLYLDGEYIPISTVKSSPATPWFNNNLKRLRSRKKRLFRIAKYSNSPQAWQRYRSAANEFLVRFQSAKEEFYQKTLPSVAQGDPKRFWKLLSPPKSLDVHLMTTSGVAVPLEKCADILNRYFVSVFTIEGESQTPSVHSCFNPRMQPFNIEYNGVIQLIDNCKLSSSCGIDGICSKLLKNTKKSQPSS